jgi:hypothetical protein
MFDLTVPSRMNPAFHHFDKTHHLYVLYRIENGFGSRDTILRRHTERSLAICNMLSDQFD